MSLRLWIARKLAPEVFRNERRYYRLRSEIEQDRWWLGHDFPAIAAFCERALICDANHWRGLDEPSIPNPWNWQISAFREQLRRLKQEGGA